MRLAIAVLSTLVISSEALAQSYVPQSIEEMLDQPGVTYDPSIPKPEDILGYQSGEVIFTPDMLHAYARALAAASDRISVEEVGRSHFGRPILRLTSTSPENQARIDEIRQNHVALSNPDSGATVTEDMPVVVQFTHGVHGFEISGYDSSIVILYHLAAAQGDAIEALLDETVINQIILINPDGANRFANHANKYHAQAPVADPAHIEHQGGWPNGRTNHYWFDLNRQWLPITQPEARALVSSTHYWRPNLAIDLHEMGTNSTYFFSPGPTDGLHPLLSQDGLQLNMELNAGIEARMDSDGELYVSEEVFDDFYLGYGSSYPGLIGSVPYLFEQSSTRGLIQESEHGLKRYDEQIAEQARVAIALLGSAHERRADLLNFQRDFARETQQMANNASTAAYVFTSNDRGRVAAFIRLMQDHNIEVRALNQSVTERGITFEPGEAYVVSTRQTQHRVIEGIFETRVITDKAEFYDVSGWTQPLAYDLDYAPVRGGLFNASVAGDLVEEFDVALPAPDRSTLAYVLEWDAFHTPRAVYRILDAGLRARVIPDEIELQTSQGTVDLNRGAVMVQVNRQNVEADDIYQLMVEAAQDGVTVHAATSGATQRGSDLGGFALDNIDKPEVLMITGPGVDMYDAGEMWHLLDFQMHIPVSMVEQRNLGSIDLARYTHILMPNGRYSNLPESASETLGEWVSDGGVLIGSQAGARYIVEAELANASLIDSSELPEGTDGGAPEGYASINAWDAEHNISGAIFAATIDTTHPLAYGFLDEDLPVHRIGTQAFEIGESPFAQPVRYSDRRVLLSGYASDRNQEGLAGKGVVHAERRGSGSVILFADRPYYRAYFLGSSRVFTNAIFFGTSFRNASRREN